MEERLRYWEVVEEECIPLYDDDGRVVVAGGQWRCGHQHTTRQSATFCKEFNAISHPRGECEAVIFEPHDDSIVFAHIESLLAGIAEAVDIIRSRSAVIDVDAAVPRAHKGPALKPVKCPPNVSDVRWRHMTANHKVIDC